MAAEKKNKTNSTVNPASTANTLHGEPLLVQLLAISRRMSEMRSLAPLLTFAMDEALALVKAEQGYIVLMREDGSLDYQINRQTAKKIKSAEADPISRTVLNKVLKSQQPLVIRNAIDDPDFAQARSVIKKKLRSIICTPLITKNRIIGAIYLENRSFSHRFTHEDLVPLEFFATQAAVAIENANLNDNLEKLVQDRTKALVLAKEGVEKVNQELEMTIMKLAKSNEQLVMSNSELEAFAHTVAHDLKTPLGSMVSFSEMIMTYWNQLPDDELQDFLRHIQQGSLKSISIIDALLLLAHLRQEDEVQLAILDIGEIVTEAIAQLRDLIADYDAQIITPDIWPTALGFSPWVEAIWINYISNAIKYGGCPPRIELGTTPMLNDFHSFWIKDNGQGITESEKEKLFTPFTRLHKTKAKGHGLGLSIVQRIVEKLGGEVAVESKPGLGSTFYFTLRSYHDHDNED